MAITRRQFLSGSALTAAAVAAPHPLRRALLGAGTAQAAPPANPILILIQLEGGNDGLNTVIPIDDAVSVQQRTLYEAARPSIGIPAANLLATEIDADPVKGNRLALHPAMTPLKTLYDQGKVAVVTGVGYPGQSLSHFRSEDIWFGADPVSPTFPSGWFGRYLDAAFTPSDLVAVDMDNTMNPIFVSQDSNVLAVTRLSDFALPGPDLSGNATALKAMYDVESDPLVTDGLQRTIGVSGDVLLGKIDDYAAVPTGWSSNLDAYTFTLARRLKQVASIIRWDATNPPAPTGARFFHVRIGGFDTHTQQGGPTGSQSSLLQRVSQAIKAFHDDMTTIGVADRVLMVTFSEFGRRVAENGSGTTAGTDHGASSVLFVVGNQVAGGVYGTVPALNDLSSGNLKFNVDFRRVYATIIDDWIATPGAHVPLLPGAPFTSLGFIA
jgi:uncharacterized protein (DUF1501 family)